VSVWCSISLDRVVGARRYLYIATDSESAESEGHVVRHSLSSRAATSEAPLLSRLCAVLFLWLWWNALTRASRGWQEKLLVTEITSVEKKRQGLMSARIQFSTLHDRSVRLLVPPLFL
jgi:hypothetical protein